ncbi:4'-phosphopantetheinyl transferase superfamily protein [Serratia sp. 3ACOL1]|uniref:4'-phosphopantetheinyl transferase family protein n=1 Tax=Serratia sp. 3ACOL1 TaxID=2448483 RepID=UPI000EF54F70|nr:4'-phosphopantetheinyl transferase superfamily protein [Serratia sp. 3ACOL1]AYM90974.1 4'-phosphopantetheinyl transferase superfamily protein [Serratia sp. 3ACOL1]
MLSSFILNAELLPVDGFAGLIAQCHFSVADYHDDLFAAAGIDFPAHVAPAVAKRKAEYLAGRYLARWVLAELGHQNFTLLRGEKREPLWPAGIAGAISHNNDTALCAAQHERGAGGVGIDVETQIPSVRAEELWSGIVSEDECQWLRQHPQPFNLLLTLVFSAKESLFKALYPQVRCYFDFIDARVTQLDMQAQTFELELQKTLTPLCHSGRRFSGRFWQQGDAVTTLIYF